MAGKLVAFDIGERLLKMAYFSGKKLIKTAAVELPDNMVSGGEITSMDAMADFIKKTAKENGIPRAKAALVLPNSLVITRNTTVPAMTEKQLAYNLPYEFKNFLSQDKSQYYYDYAVYGHGTDDGGEVTELQLFACAAQKKAIAAYRGMFNRAGFKLKSAIPEEWAYKIIGAEQSMEQDIGIVDLGHSELRLQILRNGIPETKRSANIGIMDLEQAIADDNNVDIHIAHTYAMTDYNGVLTSDRAKDIYNRMAVEILKSVNFYNYSSGRKALHRMYLCGGGAAIEGLKEAIENMLGLEILPASELYPLLAEQDQAWLFVKAVGCGLQC